MINKISQWSVFFLCISISILCNAKTQTHNSIYVDTSAIYGRVNGYLQTPQGGTVGTSSTKRPTLGELGISDDVMYQINTALIWYDVGLYGGYQYIRPSGTATLGGPLITHGIMIPAGTALKSNLKFDLYHIGMLYQFYCLQQRLVLAPVFEFMSMDFSYKLNFPTFATRDYRQGTFRLGLKGIYYFDQRFSLHADFVSSIPGVSNTTITTTHAKIYAKVFQKNQLSTFAYLGLGYLRIDFEDNQPFPNHIRYQSGVLFDGGLRVALG